jgi:hypothetical protein
MLTSVTVFELGFPMNEKVFVTGPVSAVALDAPTASRANATLETINACRRLVRILRFIFNSCLVAAP